jgi:hypothetical protein
MADPLVPGGRVRLDFAPSFVSWNSRYGRHLEDGTVVDGVEPLGADVSDITGASLFPGLKTLEQSIQDLTGETLAPRLGTTSGVVTKNITRLDTRLSLGVFDWLTVGVDVPYVKTRTAVDVAFRPDGGANLGVNPNISDPDAVSALLLGMDDAVGAAQARAADLCASGGGADCEGAQALAQRASDFQTQMRNAYLASPFFPLSSSSAAVGLSSALSSLNDALTGAGLAGIGVPIPFAGGPLDPGDFASLPTSGDAGIQGSPLETIMGLWELGDVEVSANVRLLDGVVQDSASDAPRFAYTLSGGALVRLGTGKPDDPDVFLDVGSGDGQTDVEGRVDGGLRVGRRLEFRGTVRYGVQRPTTLVRRVAPFEGILAPAYTKRAVRWTPGNYTFLDISPRWHLSEALALAADYRRYHKGQDQYALIGDQPAGIPQVDPADLERETEMTLQEASVGLRYNTVGLWRRGRSEWPLELGVRVVWAVAGSGGQTPKATRAQFSASIFKRLWGRP